MKNSKHRKSNDGIAAIRKKLGLTQHEMAEILQITRSSLVMNELGARPLPGQALLKLSLLEINLATGTDMQRVSQLAHPAERMQSKDLTDACNRSTERENTCLMQVDKLASKLATITNRYQHTRHWLHLIEKNLEKGKFTLRNEAQWWKAQQEMAIAKLADCDRSVQQVLQNKIDLLIGEAQLNKAARLQLAGT